jgi:WD40 repeat protein/serine/threonine protein kinase
MSADFDQLREIFLAALEQAPDQRDAFLIQRCEGDADLRRTVAVMLKAHADSEGPLDRGPLRDEPTEVFEKSAEVPGNVIGAYKLLEQIGEGGMGTVWMAQQQEPVKRLVAIKLVRAGMDSKHVIARFEAERQALALMDHANIARVLDAGTTSTGRPYFVMDLVKGIPITRYCDDHHLTPRQRLELFLPVCHAVQHAHQKGIIHRDLKPSNLLVALYDGKPVPKVIDFGVAKAAGAPLTDKTLVTGFGNIVGTLEYMSPEQAEINQLDIDTRSDVYALGVVLYELLTGTTPLESKRVQQTSMLEALRIIREEDAPTLSHRLATTEELPLIAANRGTEPLKLTSLVRGELDWIAMTALEKDRNRRYETANAFAADLQNYLDDKPVHAVPPSAGYRLRKFARRNKRALAMVAVLAVAVIVGVAALGVSTAVVWNANHELSSALDRERLAVAGERREAYFQRITVAHRELSLGNVAAAVRALRECPESLRGWEWHYLMRQCKVEPLVLHDTTEVYGIAFSPCGEKIASAGRDGNVKIWNSRTRRIIQEFPAHETAACSVAFHPDGQHVASAGADGLVKIWDLASPEQPVFTGPCDAHRKFGAAHTVAFRPPDGRYLAAGSEEEVRVWDWKTKQRKYSVPGAQYDSIPVAFSRDGQRLATGGAWQLGLIVRDAESGRQLDALPEPRHPVTALAFSADGGWLASASLGRTVNLWDTSTGKLRRAIPHSGNVLSVAFSADGRLLASAGEDKTVHLWDTTTGREVLGLLGHTDMCGCVAFSPDGGRLASASHDRTIIIWDATSLKGNEGQEIFTFRQHAHEIRCLAISPDGQKIASAGNGTLVRVWDAATGKLSFSFKDHTAPVFAVAWHKDSQRIATAGSAGRQNTVMVWDASDGHVQFKLAIERDFTAGPYQAVTFSPDGCHLVTGQQEGVVKVWDAKTGKGGRIVGAHAREIRGLVFSHDGRTLASASGDGTVKLWDGARLGDEQKPLRTLPARVPGPSVNVAFSRDGQRLATGGDENTIRIRDVNTGKERQILRGHRGEVYTLVFSPDDDSRWLASGGEDSTVKVWDTRTGKLVANFLGHTGLITSLAFSRDGKRLYSGSRDATVKVWDLTHLDQTSGE